MTVKIKCVSWRTLAWWCCFPLNWSTVFNGVISPCYKWAIHFTIKRPFTTALLLHNRIRIFYRHYCIKLGYMITLCAILVFLQHLTLIQAWGCNRAFSWFTRKQIVRLSIGAISTNGRSWKYTLKQLETINDTSFGCIVSAMTWLWKEVVFIQILSWIIGLWFVFVLFCMVHYTVWRINHSFISHDWHHRHHHPHYNYRHPREKRERETINVKRHFRIE